MLASTAQCPIERSKGSSVYYGLPAVRTLDRHKGFFGFAEADSILREQERLCPVTPVSITNEKPRWLPLRFQRRLRYPRAERYLTNALTRFGRC